MMAITVMSSISVNALALWIIDDINYQVHVMVALKVGDEVADAG